MDSVQRQSYKQQQVAHFMVQRNPNQTLSLGHCSGAMVTHQLPSCSASRGLRRVASTFGHLQREPGARERRHSGVGEKEVAPLCKPIRENFSALSLMSSPREISQRVQKRE